MLTQRKEKPFLIEGKCTFFFLTPSRLCLRCTYIHILSVFLSISVSFSVIKFLLTITGINGFQELLLDSELLHYFLPHNVLLPLNIK